MAKTKPTLENSYRLSNIDEKLGVTDIEKVLNDFEFFMSNYQQLVTKSRQTLPFKLNNFQRLLFSTLLPLIKENNDKQERKTVTILKPRQVGASTGLVAFINYLCSFVQGMNHLNILHVFPVGDTVTKFYLDKVSPIITGVHPNLFPNITKDVLSSSIITTYHDVKGILRDNSYEIISSSSSSIRSSTVHILIMDEVSAYKNPEKLEAAVLPALPDNGFSLVIYLSTFDDDQSDYFTDKIKHAIDCPEENELVFAPWFLHYPEVAYDVDYKTLELTSYDKDVIIPELTKAGIPPSKWGDHLNWYHRTYNSFTDKNRMKKEFPTTLKEVLAFGSLEAVFNDEDIKKQENRILPISYYRLSNDTLSRKVEAHKVDLSPIRIYKQPIYGHRYMLTVDPITSVGEDSDFFAASMFDTSTHEQVAVILGRDLPIDDWAVLSVNLATLYNRAIICPETNVAQAFFTVGWGMGYYNWFYRDNNARAKRDPGLRTTAVSKRDMIEALGIMLRDGRLTLHDIDTVDQLKTFKKIKNSRSSTVKMEASGTDRLGEPAHDDLVATLFIYCGTLGKQELAGRKRSGWGII